MSVALQQLSSCTVNLTPTPGHPINIGNGGIHFRNCHGIVNENSASGDRTVVQGISGNNGVTLGGNISGGYVNDGNIHGLLVLLI